MLELFRYSLFAYINYTLKQCNSKVGCTRPILDQDKKDIRTQLFENEELHEPQALRKWTRNAVANQRCIFGMHKAIHKSQAKIFTQWFNREENGGFLPYDSSGVMLIVRELLTYHYEIAYEMQENLRMSQGDYSPEQFNAQAIKVVSMKGVFESLSGEEFIFVAPCKSNSSLCNQRRLADGGRNHSHPVTIEPPTKADHGSYEEAIALRAKCKELKLDEHTGVVANVHERCALYRARIDDYYHKEVISLEAKKRNEDRYLEHRIEKEKVIKQAHDMISRQCWDACNANKPDRVLTLVRRGCDPNEESPRGITPLICLVINESPSDFVETLFAKKVNLDYVNKYGMTALMYACRLRLVKMIHVLIRLGASTSVSTGAKGRNRTAMHICAMHGCEEEAEVMYNYVKDGGGDSLRLARLLDAKDDDGNTPLILAAMRRNGVMCKVLTNIGANPNARNNLSRNANYMARQLGWTELADWLEKKVGAGVAKLETFSDQQFDRLVRYGALKVKEAIVSFQRCYLRLCTGLEDNTTSILGVPSKAKTHLFMGGDDARRFQENFVNNHQMYIMKRDYDDEVIEDKNVLENPMLQEMETVITTVVGLLRTGGANPNTETLPKPMAWTPLLCAVAINDVKSTKLMIREGADPNFPNKDGTTPMMLAAQLNNIEVLLELIAAGGVYDASVVDNEGYTALAYSSTLPMADNIKKTGVGYLLNGDTEGAKRICSEDLLRTAIRYNDKIDLQKFVAEANEAARFEVVEQEFKIMRLLEKNGLSRVETNRQLQMAALTAEYRIDPSSHKTKAGEKEVDNLSFEAYEAKRKAQRAQKSLEEFGGLRCPMCTLLIPCTHFQSMLMLRKFMEKNKLNDETKMSAAERAIEQMNRLKKVKVKDARQAVLDETQLADRVTDRSATLAKLYRGREIQLQKAAKEIEDIRRENEGKELAKRLAIENGTWVQYKRYSDPSGQLCVRDNESGEVWTQHFDDNGKEFWYGGLTCESRWEPPDKPLIIENVAKVEIVEDKSTTVSTETGNVVETRATVSSKKEEEESKKIKTKETTDVTSPAKGMLKSSINEAKTDDLAIIGMSLKRKTVRFNLPNDELNPLNSKAESNVPAKELDRLVQAAEKSVETPLKEEIGIRNEVEENTGERTKDVVAEEEKKVYQLKDDRMEKVDDEKPNQEHILNISTKGRPTVQQKASSSLLQGSVKGVDEYGVNPLPRDKRRLILWTTEDLNRKGITDGLLSAVPDDTLPMVNISGWAFVALSSQHTLPLESITLPIDRWGDMIEDIRSRLLNDWLPAMELGTVIDARSWKPAYPRCSVCCIGFARFKQPQIPYTGPSTYPDHSLCLSCISRKQLFEKAQRALPRSFRVKNSTQKLVWPFNDFMNSNNTDPVEFQNKITHDSTSLLPPSPQDVENGEVRLPRVITRPVSSVTNPNLLVMDVMENTRGMLGGSLSTGSVSSFDLNEELFNDQSTTTFEASNLTMHSAFTAEESTSLCSIESDPKKDEKKYGIRELSLVPFLIAKGLFEDTERMIRATLSNNAVDEGEGITTLIRLLNLLAELYKQMGLWPLALGLYMDAADLTASLLGFDDYITNTAMGLVTNCFRKMHYPTLAREYISSIAEKLRHTLDPKSKVVALKVIDADKYNIRELVNCDVIWTHHISSLQPKGDVKRRKFHLTGLGGLFHLMSSIEGHFVAAKNTFIRRCEMKNDTAKRYIRFLTYCFRMRVCDDKEIYRHLVQHLIQKELSKSLVKVSDVARVFRETTDASDLKNITQFLQHGIPVKIDVFDKMMLRSMQFLLPEYTAFMYGTGGMYLQKNVPDIGAEFCCINCIIIQSAVRRYLSKKRIIAIVEEYREKKKHKLKLQKFSGKK